MKLGLFKTSNIEIVRVGLYQCQFAFQLPSVMLVRRTECIELVFFEAFWITLHRLATNDQCIRPLGRKRPLCICINGPLMDICSVSRAGVHSSLIDSVQRVVLLGGPLLKSRDTNRCLSACLSVCLSVTGLYLEN